jgi:hypothetical protein
LSWYISANVFCYGIGGGAFCQESLGFLNMLCNSIYDNELRVGRFAVSGKKGKKRLYKKPFGVYDTEKTKNVCNNGNTVGRKPWRKY